jgi:GT2 family glycosyltransferase
VTAATTILMMSWDEAHLLEASLPAALAQPDAEVVVADNASTDSTAAVCADHGARRLRLDPRRSYAAATNEALRRTGGDAVLLLNADCVLEPSFLAAARARLHERPDVGSVAPKLIRARSLAPADRLDAIDAAGLVVDRRRKNTLVGHGRPALAYDRPGEAFGADGAAALYRRSTLRDCALGDEVLDTDLERWASDVDLAWRARTLGWKCVYEPTAVAYHVRTYSPSTRGAVPERDRRMQFRNRYLMMVKNDSPAALARDLHRLAAWEALALGYALTRERALLGGYRDALRLAGGALRRRRALDARRRTRAAVAVPLGLEVCP